MFTSSQKDTIKRLLLLFSFLLSMLWVLITAGTSAAYVYFLTHPACPPSPQARAGYESIDLRTSTGIPLRGWWRAPQNGAVVILLGGHSANRDTMLPEADLLSAHGYGVMTLDYRHCAGRPATLGARELEELETALRYVKAQNGSDWVAVLGFSVGGVTAVRGAAVHPEIRAVITQGNYDNLLADIIVHPEAPVLSLTWQVERLVALFLRLQTGIDLGSISPVDDLRRVKQPVLLIHGEAEAHGNHAEDQFQAAASAHKELWIVPGTNHGEYRTTATEEYKERILDFLEKARR